MDPLHRKAYHRFFEGYTEANRLTPDGKKRIERTYTGFLYQIDVSDRSRYLRKALYGAIYLFSILLLICSDSCDTADSETWYTAAIKMLCLLFLLWMGKHMIIYLFAKRDMIVRTYRTVKGLRNHAPLGSLCFSFYAAATVTTALTFGFSINSVRNILACLACTAAWFIVFRTETGTAYTRHPGDGFSQDIEDGYDIRYNSADSCE